MAHPKRDQTIMESLLRSLQVMHVHGESEDEEEVEYSADLLPDHCVCNKSAEGGQPSLHKCKIYSRFHCKCGQSWSSGNSWYEYNTQRLYKQQCKSCKKYTEPKTFHRLKIGGARATNGPHLEHLCERCKELGYNCSPQDK